MLILKYKDNVTINNLTDKILLFGKMSIYSGTIILLTFMFLTWDLFLTFTHFGLFLLGIIFGCKITIDSIFEVVNKEVNNGKSKT